MTQIVIPLLKDPYQFASDMPNVLTSVNPSTCDKRIQIFLVIVED